MVHAGFVLRICKAEAATMKTERRRKILGDMMKTGVVTQSACHLALVLYG
jgi:hypothetical protein